MRRRQRSSNIQQFIAGFVNLVTLGAANLISSEVDGTDLLGNSLNVTDAFGQMLETSAVCCITASGSFD